MIAATVGGRQNIENKFQVANDVTMCSRSLYIIHGSSTRLFWVRGSPKVLFRKSTPILQANENVKCTRLLTVGVSVCKYAKKLPLFFVCKQKRVWSPFVFQVRKAVANPRGPHLAVLLSESQRTVPVRRSPNCCIQFGVLIGPYDSPSHTIQLAFC